MELLAENSLRSELLTKHDLESRMGLTGTLVDFINDVFFQVKAASPDQWESDQTRPRFSNPSSFLNMLGATGICSVIFDEVNEVETPVATASIVPCHADAELIGSYWDDGNVVTEFELRAVVTHPSPVYRRQGLASRCCRLLEQVVSSCVQPHSPWILCLYTVEEESGEYWRRRGFQETKRHHLPSGTWGCKKDRTLTRMEREAPFTENDTGFSNPPQTWVSDPRPVSQPYMTSQAIMKQAVSIERRSDVAKLPFGRRLAPESTLNDDAASVSKFDELRQSCMEMLRPSGT